MVKNLTSPGVGIGSQTLSLWKNRQLVANRRRYADNAASLKPDDLTTGTPALRALALPSDPAEIKRCEGDFRRFCSTFPDVFFVSERARAYLDPKQEKGNAGRYLSAGFHNMMGYFRDDAPLTELLLDERGQRTLEGLWQEFDFVTGSPIRQYSGFLWYERAESSFMRSDEFNFARAEDKSATSETMIQRLAEVYLDKARRHGASETAVEAITDHFRIISACQIRRVEKWPGPKRNRATSRRLFKTSPSGRIAARSPSSRARWRGLPSITRYARPMGWSRLKTRSRDTVVGILMSPHFCYRVDLPSAGKGILPLSNDAAQRPWQEKLFPLVEHEPARRRVASVRPRGRPATPRGSGRTGQADAQGRPCSACLATEFEWQLAADFRRVRGA